MRHLSLLLVLALSVGSAGADPGRAPDDAAALVAGVRTIALPGVPGTLTVFGPDAFPIVAADSGGRPAALVAATRYGKGRAALFGHNYFGPALAVGDTAQLVTNVLRWLSGGAERVTIGVRRHADARPRLQRLGFEVVALDGEDWTRGLRDVDVALLPLADLKDEELKRVRRRLMSGLGVVGGMPGWGWQQLNPGRELATENAGNRLLAPAGLVWGGEYVKKPKGGVLEVTGPAPDGTHAGRALDALVAQADGERELARTEAAIAVATLTRAIREVPPEDRLLLPRLATLRRYADDARLVPTHDAPLSTEQGLGKLLLSLDIQRGRSLEPGHVEAHPAAKVFPGAVPPRAARVRRRLEVDTAVPLWHSTGLYAAPGDVVTLTVPKTAAGAGLALRIGAHKDTLWGQDTWRRAPEVTRTFPVPQTRTRVRGASAFGGLLYVVVPPKCTLGTIQVEVQGAVLAPHYVLGTTKLAAWRKSIRDHPAPWAELETAKVVLTVPSEHVRELDDPDALMRWWDRVMDACADLSARPRARSRPERYVTDEQISVGYMHAGYPIMTHLDAAPRFVDLKRLSTQGDWGMFHEMGHNHQHRDWTFGGTGEVTCNLFSLYLMETVCAKGIGHKAMSPVAIGKNRARHREGGTDFERWKAEPFTGLIMYYELKEAFGWEAYRRVFAEYRDLPPAERPKSDAEKRDQWLVRMSKTVGRDLGPFFASWGIPVSDAARAEVEALPEWMPK